MSRLVLFLSLGFLVLLGGSLYIIFAPASPPPVEPEEEPPLVPSKKPLPDAVEMGKLARTKPIVFLEACLRRYDRDIEGTRMTLVKQERIKGKLRAPEEITIACREKPLSVRMDWLKGAVLAQRTLYVRGETGGKILVLGKGWRKLAGVVSRDINGPDARDSSRYPITECSLKAGTVRVLKAWRAADKRDDLKVEYKGSKAIDELGGRICWVLQRGPFAPPEEEGITQSTFFIDKESWLLTGYILEGEVGLIGSYYFRNIVKNPTFASNTFTREGLK
jgi:hypothetical protein